MRSALETKTGMTRTELEALYIKKINFAMAVGFSEAEAREMVQGALRESLGLK